MDELDEIFNSAHGGESGNESATVASDVLDLDEIFDSAQREKPDVDNNAANTVNAVSGQVGKGLLLGWFDEFQGVEKAAQKSIANLFGRGNGKSFGENYDEATAAARAQDKTYEEKHPYLSTGAQIAGAMLPALFSGGTGLAAGPASGALPTAARTIWGVGLKEAPSLWQLAKMGLVGGSIAGAGTSEEGHRLEGAALGGATGAVAGPVVGKTVEKASNFIADVISERVGPYVDAVKSVLRPGQARFERGAIGDVAAPPIEVSNLTPEELLLAKQLKNTPLDKVEAAVQEMAATRAEGVPLFLPEALQSPKVDRNARFIANHEPSMETAQSAIRGRAETAESRANQILRAVSPEDDVYRGASAMQGAANSILSAAERERASLAAPMYQRAFAEKPLVENDGISELLSKDQILKKAVRRVKQTVNNADLPDNSTEILVKARSEIGDMIEAAKAQPGGGGREVSDLSDTYQRLNVALRQGNPFLSEADEAYEVASRKIEALNDTFLKNLRALSPDKIENVGQIFNLPANSISKLRNRFVASDKLEDWNAGVRSYLQKVVESSREGQNFTNKLTGSTMQREKLQAALGDSYEDVLRGFQYEDRMFRGRNNYAQGSPTYGYIEESNQMAKAANAVKAGFSGRWLEALGSLFDNELPDEVADGLAQIYFNPQRGSEAIEKVVPLLKKYAQNRAASSTLARGASTSATEQGARVTSSTSSQQGIPQGSAGSGERKSQTELFPEQSASPRGKSASASPGDETTKPTSLLESSTDGKQLGTPPQPKTGSKTELSAKAQLSSPKSHSLAEPNSSASEIQPGSGGMLKKVSMVALPTAPDTLDQAIESLKDNLMFDYPAQSRPVEVVEQEIDESPYFSALYEAESGRDPTIKNPRSSATGGFQFVKKTARDIGLKDPTDLDQSWTAVRNLTEPHAKEFGDDPATLYSAHFLGATTLRKFLNGEPLDAEQRAHVKELQTQALPRFMRIYNRIASEKGLTEV